MRTQIICAAGMAFAFCLAIAPHALAQAAPKLPGTHLIHGSGFNPSPMTPEQQAKSDQAWSLGCAAASDLHLGNYVQAEAEARESLAIDPNDGIPAEVLAATLEAQGKDQEALRQYQTVVEHYDRNSRNLLPYALLLLKSGQWAQAVTVYNHTLLDTERNELGKQLPLFSQEVPQPTALATAIHLERGDLYNSSSGWAGNAQNMEAMEEYSKALQLAPDNAPANYYYGVGWHKLSPAERVKFGHADQAKAALQKAAQSSDPSIKKMAEETLKKAN